MSLLSLFSRKPHRTSAPRSSGRFLILFEGRTGSTWLCDMLDAHPHVRCQHEILKPAGRKGGQDAILARFRKAVTQPGKSGKQVLGLKAKLNQVGDVDAFRQLLVELNVDIIHMKRRNLVKQVISELRSIELAEKTGKPTLYKEEDRVPAAAIDPATFRTKFQQRLKREAVMDEYVQDLPLRNMLLFYEDLQVDRERTLAKVFEFLGVPGHNVTSNLLKHTSDDLRDAVQNFDELKATLAGTPYETMFDEVLVRDAGTCNAA
jgi:LPS sulfotransferase NodH